MNPEDLLTLAAELASGGRGRPQQVRLRRAVSTIYYARFHVLANSCADQIVGRRSQAQTNQAWRQTYRALDHGEVRRKCTQGPGKPILDSHFPEGIRDFAKQFVKMQEYRHRADYDPFQVFTRSGSSSCCGSRERRSRASRARTTGTAARSRCSYCFRSEETEPQTAPDTGLGRVPRGGYLSRSLRSLPNSCALALQIHQSRHRICRVGGDPGVSSGLDGHLGLPVTPEIIAGLSGRTSYLPEKDIRIVRIGQVGVTARQLVTPSLAHRW